jgi:hypothetical protein
MEVNGVLGFGSRPPDPVDGKAPYLNCVAASLDVDNGLFELVVILEAESGDSFPMATELLVATSWTCLPDHEIAPSPGTLNQESSSGFSVNFCFIPL